LGAGIFKKSIYKDIGKREGGNKKDVEVKSKTAEGKGKLLFTSATVTPSLKKSTCVRSVQLGQLFRIAE